MLSGNCSPSPGSVLSSTLSHTFSLFSLPTPGLPPSPHPPYITENDVKPHAKTLCMLPSPTCSWAHILHLPSHDQGWRVPCSWLRLGPPLAHKIIFSFICWKTTPHSSPFSLLYRQFLSLYWNFPDSTKTHYFMYLKKNPGASLVAQWLRICLPMQGTWVRAPVWEDPTCRGATGPVSHNYWACASGACAPQQERPRQWEARALWWRVAPARHN